VLHSKEIADSLAKACAADEEGDRDDLVANQKRRFGGAAATGGARKLGARSIGKASGGADYVYNEWGKAQGGVAAAGGGGRMLLSGPQGLVARQERAAKAKKLRAKLTS